MNFNDVAIATIRIHFWYMSKDDAINLNKSSNLKKVDHYIFVIYKR